MKKGLLGILGLVALATTSLTSCAPSFDNSKLIIGLECAYAPFNWSEQNENNHTLPVANKANMFADGYDIQIAKILGEKLGIAVEIHQIEWDSLIPELQFGGINAVIAGMTDTEERRQTIDFTNEYYRSELVLVVKDDITNQYTSALSENEFADLIENKMIVSQSSTVTDDVIDIFASSYGAIHNNPVSTFGYAAADVQNGSAFAMTAELPVARSIIKAFPDLGIIHIDQNILGETQSELGVSIGIAKGNDDLCTKLNNALAEITIEQRNQIMEEAVSRSTTY